VESAMMTRNITTVEGLDEYFEEWFVRQPHASPAF
jgi:hypothetical protein